MIQIPVCRSLKSHKSPFTQSFIKAASRPQLRSTLVWLGRAGKTMLLADTDPQANPTASSGQKNADALKMPVSDAPEAIMPEKDLLSENMILHHDEGINLIPGIIRPADIDRKLTGIFVKEKTD